MRYLLFVEILLWKEIPCLMSPVAVVSDLYAADGSRTREQLKREAGGFANEVGSYIPAL
jgi:hypothetical protein